MGDVLVARPTTYDGIPMRSRLEATFAAFLDRTEFSWEYEPRAWASHSGTYLPDFVIDLGKARAYIDVKGVLGDGDVLSARAAIEHLIGRMRVIRASDPTANLFVAAPLLSLQPGHPMAADVSGWSGIKGVSFVVCPSCRGVSLGWRTLKGAHVMCHRCQFRVGAPVAFLDPFYRPEAR